MTTRSSILFALLLLSHCFCALAQTDQVEALHYRMTQDQMVALDCGDCSAGVADLTVSGDYLYFTADNGLFGREIWQMDAEERIQAILLFNNGKSGSDPSSLLPFNDGLAFLATPRTQQGAEIAPPALFYLAPDDPKPRQITQSPRSQATLRAIASGKWLYFDQDMPDTGRELWITDGTVENTRLVADLAQGSTSALNEGLFGVALPNGGIAFYALSNLSQVQGKFILYETAPPNFDARPILVDGNPVYMPPPPVSHATLDDGVLLNAHGPASEYYLLHISAKGDAPQFLLTSEDKVVNVWEMAGNGNHAYFSCWTREHGAELWLTDGTRQGTRMLKDIWPGEAGGGAPHKLTISGDRLYFVANDGTHGGELWSSDGTEEGTKMILDFMPGEEDGAPYQLTAFQGLCYFAVENQQLGEELWRTDGTRQGTWMVRDIHPGRGDAEPYYLKVFNNRIYFCAQDGQRGEELWVTDGTSEGTQLLHDMMQPLRWVTSSNPEQLTAFDGSAYFVALDGLHGRELWKANPTHAELVIDLVPGRTGANIEHLCVHDGSLSFDADTTDGARAQFLSDGTAAGTRPIGPALGRKAGPALEELLPEAARQACLPGPLPDEAWVATKDYVFFRGFSRAEGFEPWVWRRGDAEARLVRDHFPGPAGSHPKQFLQSGDAIFYIAEIATGKTAIFRVTPQNLDVSRVSSQIYAASTPRALAAVPGGVVFVTDGPIHFGSFATFVSQNYHPQTKILPFNVAIPAHKFTRSFVHTGNALYFDCYDPFHGRELWVKQDHLDAPNLVRDIFPESVRK